MPTQDFSGEAGIVAATDPLFRLHRAEVERAGSQFDQAWQDQQAMERQAQGDQDDPSGQPELRWTPEPECGCCHDKRQAHKTSRPCTICGHYAQEES